MAHDSTYPDRGQPESHGLNILSLEGVSLWREFRAGAVNFMTMAYILALNPFFLTQAGVPADTAVIGTAWAAAIGCIVMGLVTNLPFAMAPGMGLNAALAFGVILGLGVTWEVGMGLIVVEALLVFLAVQVGLRERLMFAIPEEIRLAIGAGIGVFLLWLGLEAGGQGFIRTTQNPGIFGSNIDFWEPSFATEMTATTWLLLLGLALIAVLRFLEKRTAFRGALLVAILATVIVAIVTGSTAAPETYMQSPALPHLVGVGNVWEVLVTPALYASVFAFFMADFFDTLGTGVAVSKQGGFYDRLTERSRLRRFLSWDALAAAVSGFFSASSTTTYIESSAGVEEGGRTGLTSVFTGLLFLASLMFVPLALVVASTPGATSAVLIFIGILMLATLLREVNWRTLTTELWVAIILTIVVMPLTKSITAGIGVGIIAYVILSILFGHFRNVGVLMPLAAIGFLVSFFI